MAKLESIGIQRLESIHYYVHDLERSRRFYRGMLDFQETWRSSPELEQQGHQRSACFAAGDINVICSQPLGDGGRLLLAALVEVQVPGPAGQHRPGHRRQTVADEHEGGHGATLGRQSQPFLLK